MNEWATAPLLDQSNVGKDVWTIWNGNRHLARRETIFKVTRTNIHTRSGSYRVTELGTTGGGSKSGCGIYCETEAWRAERNERDHLAAWLRGFGWSRLPLAQLREIAAGCGYLTGQAP